MNHVKNICHLELANPLTKCTPQSVVHQVLLKMEGWHAYPQKVVKLIFYPLGMPISLQLVFYPLKFCQAA